MKRIVFLALIAIMAISSCAKEGIIEEERFGNAIIRDFGDIAVDGCGWVVDVSSEIYKPQNLPAEFEIDSLEVQIEFDTLASKARCGFVMEAFFEIHIIEISKIP